MNGLGLLKGNPAAAVPAAFILCFSLISCVGIPEPKKNDSDTIFQNPSQEKQALHENGEPERFPGDEIAEPIPESSTDPLEEVSRLWYGGYHDEARKRFWKDDVRALAHGERDSEWSIWRGRLFMECWSGSQLGLAGENVSALLADHDDIWIGTWTGGITRFSRPLEDYTLRDSGRPSLAVRTVNSIVRYGDTVWVVRYGGVERYDLRSGVWSNVGGLPVAERIQDLHICKTGTYLATLGHGMWLDDGTGWRMIRTPGLFITNLEPGADDELIVMTMDRGLFVLDAASNTWNRPPSEFLREVNVTSAVRYGERIYGGTYGFGAFVWNTESGDVERIDSAILGDSYVLAAERSQNRIFFGTFGAGLVSWNPESDTWDRVSLKEGLPSADIAALQSDGMGNIWAGTLGGGVVNVSGGIHGD